MAQPSPITARDFLRDALAPQLHALQAQGEVLASSADAAAVHQARVATRRLRAALDTFRPLLARGATRPRRMLRDLARSLSAARDLDVAIARLEQWRTSLPRARRDGLDLVLAALHAQRTELEPRIRRRCTPARLRSVSNAVEAADGPELDAPVSAVASILLRPALRGFRRARKRARRKPSAPRVHALRIRGKKLRYALELLDPLLGKASGEVVAQLRTLQSSLGEFQDAAVIQMLLERLLLSADPQLRLPPPARRACEAAEVLCAEKAEAVKTRLPELIEGLNKRSLKELCTARGAR